MIFRLYGKYGEGSVGRVRELWLGICNSRTMGRCGARQGKLVARVGMELTLSSHLTSGVLCVWVMGYSRYIVKV